MSTLQFFWDLASVNPTVRNKAAVSLLTVLNQFQKQYEEENKDNWEDYLKDQSADRLDSLCSPDVLYSLKRLIRGLSSSRDGARQGFSVALTELLSMLSFIKITDVLNVLNKATEITGGMKSQEEKEMLFGKLFGIASIIQSGMIESHSSTSEELQTLFDNLLSYSTRKSYLKESCYKIIILLFTQVKKINNEEVAKYIISETLKTGVDTPEELAFTIVAQDIYPNYDYKNLIKWKETNVLHSSNSSRLATILKESSYTHPHIHFVWDTLLSKIINNKINNNITLQDLWITVVDECLFNSTYERKYLGFSLFKIILPKLSSEEIPLVFAPNFMRSLINNLSMNKTYLHKLAIQLIDSLVEISKSNSSIAITLVAQLTGKNGNQNFDKITKTKTIESIVSTLNIDGIKSYIDYLRKVYLDQEASENDEKKVEVHRSWVIDQLVYLIKNPKIPKDNGIYYEIFEFLFINAYCTIEKVTKNGFSKNIMEQPNPVNSSKTQELCRSRFLTVLGESLNLNESNEDTLPSIQLINTIEKLNSLKSVKIIVELDEETKEAMKNAKDIMAKIQNKIKNTKDKEEIGQLKAFELLLVHLIILMYSEPEESISAINDIINCYIRIFPEQKSKNQSKKRKAKTEEEEEEEEEANPIEVLIDVLLSFLIKPSLLLRNLTEKVFKAFCGRLTKNSIDLIINVLNPEAENGNVIEEEGSDDDMDIDEKEGEEGNDDNENEDDDDDDDVEIVEDDDDDEEVDEELRRKVQAVLQGKVQNAGEEGEEEEELSDLNDDEMLDFDEKLAEIFKQRKIIKSTKKETKQQLLHFKFKVLEMLDIFIKKQSTNALIMELIMPLLQLVKQLYGGENNQLFERVQSLLKNRLLKIKDYPKTNVDNEQMFKLLEEVNQFAEKCNETKLCNLTGEVSIFIIKVILGNNTKKNVKANANANTNTSQQQQQQQQFNPKIVERIGNFYKELLNNFMTKNHTNLRPSQFVMVIQRFPMVAWTFIDDMVKHLSPNTKATSIKVYQLCQVYRLVELLFNGISKQDESNYATLIKKIVPGINEAQANVCKVYQNQNEGNNQNTNNKEKTVIISQARLKEICKSLNNISRKAKKILNEDVIDTTKINKLRTTTANANTTATSSSNKQSKSK